MIDFDEEVSKFQPSMEIDRVEDTIAEEKLRDISDIVTTRSKRGSRALKNPPSAFPFT